MNWIDNSIGKHGQSLSLLTRRAEVIAGNIANADTPRYKAQDLDFASALKGAQAGLQMRATHANHLGASASGATPADIVERVSDRSSPDGNTVQIEDEQAAYAQNAVKFQASAQFFDGSLRGLRKALRME